MLSMLNTDFPDPALRTGFVGVSDEDVGELGVVGVVGVE